MKDYANYKDALKTRSMHAKRKLSGKRNKQDFKMYILNACFTFGCALLSLFMRNAYNE